MLPSEAVTSEQIEDVMALFQSLGANVIEGASENFPNGWVSKEGVTQLFNNRYRRSIPADILTVHKIDYIASVTKRWAAEDGQPQFNWDAIFNFHPEATVFSVSALNRAQALMQVKVEHVVKRGKEARAPVVYISFLEIAPWNRWETVSRTFSGLGPMLVRLAVVLSLRVGTNGRVGLHSLAGIEGFYEKLGFKPIELGSEAAANMRTSD